MDQCARCIKRGNYSECITTDCNFHENWIAEEGTRMFNKALAKIESLEERNVELLAEVELLRDQNKIDNERIRELKKLVEAVEFSHDIINDKVEIWIYTKPIDGIEWFEYRDNLYTDII